MAPCLDARDELSKSMQVWVKLLSLPMEMCSDHTLKGIGDTLGKIILEDDNYKKINST